jgi:processive 1,2-diacylglycerol beta-glucosyltransferase
LIAKRKLRARNAIVVTDYHVLAMWLCRTVDRYYVAIQESAEYLAGIGVPRENLRVTGIPIDPVFEAPAARDEAHRKLGISLDVPVLLISAGGYGIGPVEKLVEDLLAFRRCWQLVAIAGKAEKPRKRLEQISKAAEKLSGGNGRRAV